MSYFDAIVSIVSALKPGQATVADDFKLGKGWGGMLGELFGGGLTPADRVLENVIGSSATHRYSRDRHGQLVFSRLYAGLPDGIRSYVSPDRRHYFAVRHDGLFQHREQQAPDEGRILCALRGHQWIKAWLPPRIELASYEAFPVDAEATTVQLIEGQRCSGCRSFRPSAPLKDQP